MLVDSSPTVQDLGVRKPNKFPDLSDDEIKTAAKLYQNYRTLNYAVFKSDICDAPVTAFEEGADVMSTAKAFNKLVNQLLCLTFVTSSHKPQALTR